MIGTSVAVICWPFHGGQGGYGTSTDGPGQVERLVVVDIAPVSYPKQADGHMQVIAGMKALELDGLDSRATAEAFLRRYIDDEPTRKFVLTNLNRNPGAAITGG